ncbi:MAG: sterol desaturase family protein [Variibacter sp.]|nr:sterol desaturase family protein [Variibacter sp.]
MPDVTHLPAAVFESTNFRSFNRAFVRLHEIWFYAGLLAIALAVGLWMSTSVWQIVLPVVLVVGFYPPFEYVLHRWVLHATYLCKTPFTARIWWRIHYRHHSQPQDSAVILGAPWSLLVAVGVGALLATSLLWSWGALAMATAAGLGCAIAYEYFHSLEHSRVELRNPYLLRMRKHHIAHHYVDENGNYGITTDVVDRLVGTAVNFAKNPARSPTVNNLGYTSEVAQQYPWVEEIEREVGSGKSPGLAGEAKGR